MSTFGEELIQSLNEALDHAKGEGPAIVHAPVSPREVRRQAKLTQAQMAPLMGMSLSGYRKWEQGTRRVSGPAAALLRMIEREPDAVIRTLSWNVERRSQHRDEQECCLEMPHPESKSATSRSQRHSDEMGERGHMATTPEDMGNWNQVAEILNEALPQIDQALSQANVPVSSRKLWSFDIVRDTMLEVSDHKAFLLSEVHGRFLVIIEDWYRDRYGGAIDEREGDFESMVLIHGTPFAMRVPKRFRLFSGEQNAVWIGYPASVQAEEDPLVWIQNKDAVRGLSGSHLETAQKSSLETANLVRSISFDLQLLENDANLSIAELAASVRADLQSSARNLCAQNDAGLRSATWEASQATEKALKILIWRKGQTPPHSHELCSLAFRAEELGAGNVDREKLARIPSGRAATGLRYGGDMTVSDATGAYGAALSIIRQVIFEAKPDTKYNWRGARFEVKRPSWFNFDTGKFSANLRSM